MNPDYVRQIAAECDEQIDRLASDEEPSAAMRGSSVRALARAAAVLHLIAGSERPAERPNGVAPPDGAGKPVAGRVEPLRAQLRRQALDALGMDPFRDWDDALNAMRGLIEERNHLRTEVADARRQAADMHGRRTVAEEGIRKRWHEAAIQRDALVRAARGHMNGQCGRSVDGLRAVVEQVESGGGPHATLGYTLRRELWHVLDREPDDDESLIATVRQLVADLDRAERELHGARKDSARTARERNELLGELGREYIP